MSDIFSSTVFVCLFETRSLTELKVQQFSLAAGQEALGYSSGYLPSAGIAGVHHNPQLFIQMLGI